MKKGIFRKGALNITPTILAVIGVVIAITMVPVIIGSQNDVLNNNVTANGTHGLSGSSVLLLTLITFVFVAGIVVLSTKKFMSK